MLGIVNLNNDSYINFINFINLCAKTFIRENENKDIYVSTCLIRLKELAFSIKDKELKLLFDDVW